METYYSSAILLGVLLHGASLPLEEREADGQLLCTQDLLKAIYQLSSGSRDAWKGGEGGWGLGAAACLAGGGF